MDSEGAHGNVEGEDGPPFKGKEKEPPSGKEVMFWPRAWKSLSQKRFLTTHDSQATQTELLTLYSQPTVRHWMWPHLTPSCPTRSPGLGSPLTTPFPHTPHPRQQRVLTPFPPHPSLMIYSSPVPWRHSGPLSSLTCRTLPPSIWALTAQCPGEAT